MQLSRVGNNDNALIIKYTKLGTILWASGIGGTGGLGTTNPRRADVSIL